MLTEEAANALLAQRNWYAQQVEMSQQESEKAYLTRLGFRVWSRQNNRYEHASDAAADAWRRQNYPALIAEFHAYHAPYPGEWNLYMLTALPAGRAADALELAE